MDPKAGRNCDQNTSNVAKNFPMYCTLWAQYITGPTTGVPPAYSRANTWYKALCSAPGRPCRDAIEIPYSSSIRRKCQCMSQLRKLGAYMSLAS